MGRQLQKKKQRSSRPKIRQSQKPKKVLNPRGNDLIAKNWSDFFLKALFSPIECRTIADLLFMP
jgi:hypothetical protein